MRSSGSFNAQGAVGAIGISWTFDEFYTQFTTDGIDSALSFMSGIALLSLALALFFEPPSPLPDAG